MADSSRNTLVIGHPRSGTTWVADVLAAGRDLVSEPDNEVAHPLGFGFKRSHRFPGTSDFASSGLPEVFRRASFGDPADIRRRALQRVLLSQRWRTEPWVAMNCGDPEATSTEATRRPRLSANTLGAPLAAACRTVMTPGSPNHDGRVIKSVHGVLCAEDIERATSAQIVTVFRNPFAVLASLRRPLVMASRRDPVMNPDRWRNVPGLPKSSAERDIHQLLFLMKSLARSFEKSEGWILVSHDEACRHPSREFERIASELQLDPAPVMDRLRNTAGEGDGLSVRRNSSADQIDTWKKSLSPETVELVQALIGEYKLSSFLERIGAVGER